MENKKITQLTELTILNAADLLAVVDDVAGTPVTKKLTVENLFDSPSDINFQGAASITTAAGILTLEPALDLALKTSYVYIGDTEAGGHGRIRLGYFATGNRYAIFDMIADDTYDYGIRIIRNNTGANAISTIAHRGTGALELETVDVAHIKFVTHAVDRWAITDAGVLYPYGAGTYSIGSASAYVNVINYKELTDRGCLGWYEDGVEMPDGKKVKDVEAIKLIKKHPTLKTGNGIPRLDYASMPIHVYKPAPIAKRKIYEDVIIQEANPDTGKEEIKKKKLRWKKGEKMGDDGAELTALVSIMLGAIKELAARVEAIEK